ncbi:MAG TPA: AsmA family protein, partial [Burkholderiales bacterium]|nr:AsmA family protein [Burkholderiales bacterium]
MNLKTIFTKTGKGMLEMKNKALPKDISRILTLVDGKSTVGSLLGKDDKLTESKLRDMLKKLEDEGYIRIFSSGPETLFQADLDFTKGGKGIDVSEVKADVYNQAKARQIEQSQPPPRVGTQPPPRPGLTQPPPRPGLTQPPPRGGLTQPTRPAPAAPSVADLARAEAEARAKKEAEEKVRKEAEARAKAEADARAKNDAEARAKAETESRARAEAEAKAKAQAELKAKAEAEARAKVEAEAKAKRETEARLRAEAESRARAEADAKAKTEAEAKAKSEAEAKAKAEADAKARAEAEARATAEVRAKEEAAAKARLEAEAKAKAAAEARAKVEAEARARKEAEEKAEAEARRKKEEAALAAKYEQEAKAKIEADAQIKRDAETKAKAEMKAREDAEARSKIEAAKYEHEAKSKIEAEARNRREAETKTKAEMKAREETEARSKIEAERRMQAEIQAQLGAGEGAPVKPQDEEKLRKEARAKAEEAAWAKAEAEIRESIRESAKKEGKAKSSRMEEAEKEEERRKAKEREELQARERAKAEEKAKADAEALRVAKAKAKAEEEAKEREAAKKMRASKKPFNWKPAALILGLLIAAAVGLVQLIPLNNYIPRIEKLASDTLHEPVSINNLYVSLFPSPQVKLEGFTIGTLKDIKIETVRVPGLDLVLGGSTQLGDVQVDTIALDQDALPRLARWTTATGGTPALQISRVDFKNVRLALRNIPLAPLQGIISLAPDGAVRQASLQTSDGKLSAEVTGKDRQYEVKLSARGWQSPIGPEFAFDSLEAQGVATSSEMQLSSIRARLYGGTATGTADIHWDSGWGLSGDYDVKGMDVEQVMVVFSSHIIASGTLASKGNYSMQAQTPEKLFDAPRL